MIVGVEARLLSGNKTGIGRYVFELLRNLENLLPKARFVLYSPWPFEWKYSSDRWHIRIDPLADLLSKGRSRWFTKNLWAILMLPRLVRVDRLDVFWATQAPFIPLVRDDNAGPPVVTTLHDLPHRVAPRTLRRVSLAGHLILESRLRHAHAIVTNSQGTAERLKTHLGLDATAVVNPGVSSEFAPKGATEIAECLRRYGVERPYLLAVASADKRKNLEALVKAFMDFCSLNSVHNLTLAIVGDVRQSKALRRVQRLLNRKEAASIRWLGFVADSDLPALYSGAEGLLFPSLYEGFGMPVLEARACGTPVLTSDLPETREAGENDAIYVTPTVEGIVSGIGQLLSQSKRPSVDRDRWSWRRSAEMMASVIEEVASGRRTLTG